MGQEAQLDNDKSESVLKKIEHGRISAEPANLLRSKSIDILLNANVLLIIFVVCRKE